MRAVNKHPRARRDLIDIWFYTLDHWDEEQADRYLRQIDEAIQRLGENPWLGADCSEIRTGYRRVTAGQHRIYYRLEGDAIEIVRVLHVSRDAGAQLDN